MAIDGTGGLRERKRRSAMRRIQDAALDLFEERGFHAVTVEEVAEATDVSPSSVYRWFGTKEALVLWDDFGLHSGDWLADAVGHEVPLEGLRRSLLGRLDEATPAELARARRQMALVMATPSLDQALAAATYEMAELAGRVLAERLRRPEVDLEVQVFAHVFTGGLLGMLHHWCGTGFAEPLRDVAERLFVIFEEGLDVVTATGAAAPGEVAGAPV